MAKNKFTILVDPLADFGRMKHRWPFFKEKLRALDQDFDSYFRTDEFTWERLVNSALVTNPKGIIVAGDDSTVHHVVNHLKRLRPQINDFPHVGILCSTFSNSALLRAVYPKIKKISDPECVQLCINAATKGKPKVFDLGVVQYKTDSSNRRHLNKDYFLNMASFGLSSQIINELFADKLARLSRLGILTASMQALLNFKAPEVTITLDNQKLIKKQAIFNFFIARSPYNTIGMHVAPKARLDDGKLHFLAIPNAPVSELLLEIPKLWLENVKTTNLIRRSSTAIVADWSNSKTRQRAFQLELDGVPKGTLPAKFEVERKGLKFLVQT